MRHGELPHQPVVAPGMNRPKNRLGERHGLLKVIWYLGDKRWLTVCDCGYARTFDSHYLHRAAACGQCYPVRGDKRVRHVKLTARDQRAADLWRLCGDFHVVEPLTDPDDTPARRLHFSWVPYMERQTEWRLPT